MITPLPLPFRDSDADIRKSQHRIAAARDGRCDLELCSAPRFAGCDLACIAARAANISSEISSRVTTSTSMSLCLSNSPLVNDP